MEDADLTPPPPARRMPSGPLYSMVRDRGKSMGLFQLLRVLEAIHPEKKPVGAFGDPAQEVARIAQNPSLGFPAREVQDVELQEGDRAEVLSNVLGMVGTMGVLPHPYSVLVLERGRARDTTLQAFLDIFHHRALSLLYQAWRKGIPELALERGEDDQRLRHLLDLIGVGHEPESALPGVSGETLAWYMGLLAPPARSGPALEQLLADRFGVPVEVEPFVGGWISLRDEDLCRLGEEDEADTLGTGAVVGDEVWDPHARIRIRIGPLDRESYDGLLPGRSEHLALARLVRFFTHDQFEVELQLVLNREEVTGTVLGGDDRSSPPLGWGTWLRSRPREHDADETILTL